jgi:hypothetical protein
VKYLSLLASLQNKYWARLTSVVCFLGGIQLICIGVLGEYIGKIYLEVKARPRYIISDRTYEKNTDLKKET